MPTPFSSLDFSPYSPSPLTIIEANLFIGFAQNYRATLA